MRADVRIQANPRRIVIRDDASAPKGFLGASQQSHSLTHVASHGVQQPSVPSQRLSLCHSDVPDIGENAPDHARYTSIILPQLGIPALVARTRHGCVIDRGMPFPQIVR